MDLKSTISIILKDLEDARDIIDDLGNYPGIPAIQIELAKGKCRNAEEVIKLLRDMDIPGPGNPPSHEKEEILTPGNNDFQELSVTTDLSDNSLIEISESPVTEEIPGDTDSLDLEILDQIIQPESKEAAKEADEIRKNPKTKIVADRFTRESSINERIAFKRKDEENGDKRNLKPLSKISDAIGLNDKFLYVRELFGGDIALYNETLAKLNNTGSVDEAFDMLSKITSGSENNTAFDQMLDLVKRKLSTQ